MKKTLRSLFNFVRQKHIGLVGVNILLVLLALFLVTSAWECLVDIRYWEAPRSAIDKVHSYIEKEGFRIVIDDPRIRLNGKIQCKGLRLTSLNDERYSILAKDVNIKISLWWLLLGQVRLERCRFEEIEIVCSEGVQTPVRVLKVRQGDFEKKWIFWHASRGQLQLNDIFVTYAGVWHMWPFQGSSSKLSLEENYRLLLERVEAFCSNISLGKPLFLEANMVVSPSISIDNVIKLSVTGESLACSPGWSLKSFNGYINLSFGEGNNPVFDGVLHFKDLDYRGDFQVRSGLSEFQGYTGPGLFGLIGFDGYFQGYGFSGYEFEWGSLDGEYRLLDERRIHLSLDAVRAEEWIEWKGVFDIKEGSCQVKGSGFFSPENIYELPALKSVSELQRIRFYDTPYWRFSAVFGASMAFEQCDLFIDTRSMDLRGVPLDGLSLRAQVTPKELRVYDVDLTNKEFTVKGSYTHEIETLKYRFLLEGGIRPDIINDWMFDWWVDLWAQFEFNEALPVANMDIQGQWGSPEKRFIYGSATVQACRYHDAYIHGCDLTVFSRPYYLRLYDFKIRDAIGGQAHLDVQWVYHPVYSDPYMLLIQGEGTLALDAIGKALGGDIEQVIMPFNASASPSVKVDGIVFGIDSPLRGLDYIDVTVSFPASLTYHGVPLDWLSGYASKRHGHIGIHELEFGLAKGIGSGAILIQTMDVKDRLTFNLEIKDAGYDSFLTVLPSLKGLGVSPDDVDLPVAEIVEDKVKTPVGGFIDVNVSGTGFVGDFNSFNMDGGFYVRDAALGELSIFGPLSGVLEKVFLRFSRLDLNQMQGSFYASDNKIRIEKMDIEGPAAKMEGKGAYSVDTDLLDFSFSVHLLGATRVPIFSQVINFIDPVSKIFRVRLTGPFSDPQWNVVLTPFGMLEAFIPSESHAEKKRKASPLKEG